LKKRFTHKELGCFFGAGDGDVLENNLVDKATRNVFDLLWKAIALLAVEVFPYF